MTFSEFLRERPGEALIGLLLIMLLGVLTMARNEVWRSEETLWQDAIVGSPRKPRPVINLARHYQIQGDYVRAAEQYRKALAIAQLPGVRQVEKDSTRLIAFSNVADMLIRLGQYDAAEANLLPLWNEYPGFPGAALGLSNVYMVRNEPEKAIQVLDVGIFGLQGYGWFTDSWTLYANRGTAYQALRECALAHPDYEQAKQLWPPFEIPAHCP